MESQGHSRSRILWSQWKPSLYINNVGLDSKGAEDMATKIYIIQYVLSGVNIQRNARKVLNARKIVRNKRNSAMDARKVRNKRSWRNWRNGCYNNYPQPLRYTRSSAFAV